MGEEKILISEIFESLQGEGPYVGCPSLFVRFVGCSNRCSWCDTKYAWSEGKLWDKEELWKKIFTTDIDDIIFTGGEPLLQYRLLARWSERLRLRGRRVFLETSGVFGCGYKELDRKKLAGLIQNAFWIVSPKSHIMLSNYEWMRYYRFDLVCWKFVWEGWEETKDFILRFFEYIRRELYKKIEKHTVFVMPKGATKKEVLECEKEVWAFCQEYKFRYSPREHIVVWGKKKGK